MDKKESERRGRDKKKDKKKSKKRTVAVSSSPSRIHAENPFEIAE